MILVGLAGQIGVGKSTVAARLAEHGAHVIDADRLAHGVLEIATVRTEIIHRFGDDILDAEGRVHRPSLAARVFGPTAEHTAALDALEEIVHPVVRSRIEAEIDRRQRDAGDQAENLVIILDVPLLVQSGWAERCDRIIEVRCDDDVRKNRLQARGWSLESISWRDAAWLRRLPRGGLNAVVDAARIATVDTSSTISYTQKAVDRVWRWIWGDPLPC